MLDSDILLTRRRKGFIDGARLRDIFNAEARRRGEAQRIL